MVEYLIVLLLAIFATAVVLAIEGLRKMFPGAGGRGALATRG